MIDSALSLNEALLYMLLFGVLIFLTRLFPLRSFLNEGCLPFKLHCFLSSSHDYDDSCCILAQRYFFAIKPFAIPHMIGILLYYPAYMEKMP